MNKVDPSAGQSAIKRLARRVARGMYRLGLPLARPIAFRTRRFLLAGLHDEVRSTREGLQSMRQEVQSLREELLHEIRHNTAIGSEVMVNTAQSVQHAVLAHAHHWYLEGHKDLQIAAADLHKAQHASRESLRDEAQRIAMKTRALMDLHAEKTRASIERHAVDGQLSAHTASMYERMDRIETIGHTLARRVAVHCEENTVLVKTSVGYVLCSDSDHAVLACLIETGELEFGTRLLIERFLEPGDVFVDVGAHLGMMSLAAARALKGQGHIFAFEPFPQTRSLLEKTFWINELSHMITIRGAAVSDQSGEKAFHLGLSSGHHSLFALDLPPGHQAEQMTVPVVTLDEALPSGQRVSLIKIDAEGAEIDIIRGAHQLETNNPDMAYIVEFGASHLKRVGNTIENWLKAFTDLGLVYKAINLNSGALETITLAELEAAASVNLFFARPGSIAWIKGGSDV